MTHTPSDPQGADEQSLLDRITDPEGRRQFAELTARLKANPTEAQIWFERGRLLWQYGLHGAAMSDYGRAADLDPASPATAALEQARRIMAFYHRDLYNP